MEQLTSGLWTAIRNALPQRREPQPGRMYIGPAYYPDGVYGGTRGCPIDVHGYGVGVDGRIFFSTYDEVARLVEEATFRHPHLSFSLGSTRNRLALVQELMILTIADLFDRREAVRTDYSQVCGRVLGLPTGDHFFWIRSGLASHKVEEYRSLGNVVRRVNVVSRDRLVLASSIDMR